MAQKDQELFGFKKVKIFKDEHNSLGVGSYGAVYKASCDELPCAAKILHPTLFQSNDPGARKLLQRFEQECSFMNRIRHPNIVLFLGVSTDVQSGLPVLLMELLDESLTKFLERSTDPLPFHIQVNLSHDIALALAYLHSNSIIHRDLSSNNVLLIAGSKAKVTDFGMSKLADTSSTISRFSRLSLTQCPGTEVYMPPEALKEPPVYMDKLDCFSFGPLTIQIITRLFPKPGCRSKTVPHPASPTGTIDMPVLETVRRQSHISLIDPQHSLLAIATQCLEYKPDVRPSARELCNQLSRTKRGTQYSESKQEFQDRSSTQERMLAEKVRQNEKLTVEIEELQLENGEFRAQKETLHKELDSKEEKLQEMEAKVQQMKLDLQAMKQLNKEKRDVKKKESVDKPENRQPSSKPTISRSISTPQRSRQNISGRYESHVIPQQRSPKKQQPSPKLNLPRSISTTNLETTGRCRTVIKQDWVPNAPIGGTKFFTSTPCYTFTLPSLEGYPPEFKKFVLDCIVDKETQRFLEGEQYLNWCPSATKLVPLTTLGDGNCLLHAASLGMWGFQDREHVLRRAVSQALFNHHGNTFYERWKFSREQEHLRTGTRLEPHQWHHEWQETVRLASAEVIPGRRFNSLERFHVFVLANILRRPIIMYASPKMKSPVNDAILLGLNFQGVYLPLLWDPKSCKKDPLPLAYYGGHFSALTVIESPQHYPGGFMLPLCDYYGVQLPVRYSLPVEDSTSLLMDYLNLVQVRGTGSPYITTSHMICAKLTIPESPAYLQPLISGFIDACREVFVWSAPSLLELPTHKSEQEEREAKEQQQQQLHPYGHPLKPPTRPKWTLCATSGCSFKGYSELNGYCPDCCGLPNVLSDKFPLV